MVRPALVLTPHCFRYGQWVGFAGDMLHLSEELVRSLAFLRICASAAVSILRLARR